MKVKIIKGKYFYKIGEVYEVYEVPDVINKNISLLQKWAINNLYSFQKYTVKDITMGCIDIGDCEKIDVYRSKQIDQILHEDKV